MASMNPSTAPSTGLDRWRYVRTGGSALFTAWRTRRRWTPNFRATPLIVPIPNSYSRRNCSNSSPFVLLPPPPLPLVQRKDGTPRQKGGPNSVSKVGRHPIANSPFRWNSERRAFLRAELDAYYTYLYGLTRDELRYILDPSDV